MMVKKTLQVADPWIILEIEKKRGIRDNEVDDCDRPYCQHDGSKWVGIQRYIKLSKQWDLYDLAQEFIGTKKKEFYVEPTEPRPVKDKPEVLEGDYEPDSDNEEINEDDMNELFDDEDE